MPTPISNNALLSFLQNSYDLKGDLRQLPGEIDFNYYLTNKEGQSYTIKIAHPEEKIDHLHMQNAIMKHLSKKDINLRLPDVLHNKDQEEICQITDSEDHSRFLRVLTWVEGKIYAQKKPQSLSLLENLGKACGQLCQNLLDFDHPGTHRTYKWDLAQASWIQEYFYLFEADQLELINYFFDLFEEIQDTYQNLRKSVIYNDANDYNIIVSKNPLDQEVEGFIDFGDAMFTQTINELAIAIAYGVMDKENPLEAACSLVKGFHKTLPLREEEVKVLYTLAATRLIVSLTVSAINKKEHPDNKYLLVSERGAWELLERWKNIPPSLAFYAFRKACGWAPCPQKSNFEKWIENNHENISSVVNLSDQSIIKMDLSVGSLELGNNQNFNDIHNFESTINTILAENDAQFGIGGYGEIRPVYTTDAYLIKGNTGPQWRTVHLGIDIWGKARTSVFAPLDGIVHSFQNNEGDKNYGPTIILEHKIDDDLTFYTLYGHLSLDSLNDLEKGKLIKKGEQFAYFGPHPENGNWPPHLHFQIMLDMLGMEGDFPGVGFPEEYSLWLSICPNGAAFFKPYLDFSPAPTLSKSKILSTRKQNLGKGLSISYQNPLHILRGYKQYLYDQSGRRFLDTVNNVAHVGHEHPKVVKAAQRQSAVLNTNTRYLHPNIIKYAEELLSTFPPQLNVVHFVNSGSEANELALRMARTCTGHREMIAVEVGYHGNTTGCVDISSYKFDGKGGRGAPPTTHVVPIPDTYRGLYRDPQDAGKKYASYIDKAIKEIQQKGRNVGGFICESILSCGGQIVLPENYLREGFKAVREAGGLCIVDEVQVGFGRVGKHFWGFELQGVIPDIVTLGKPIGNGHPLGAVVTTSEVASAFANGMEYFSTFGGNPVSCAIGSAVLGVIKDEGLQENALEVGQYLTFALNQLKEKYPLIGDVRGHGLFLGFELVRDLTSLEPADHEATYLANRMREHGILMSTDGPFYNVLKIKPPICFDKKNVDFLIETLDKVLDEDYLRK